MTNIESADEIVAKIRNAGWWQGSVVDEATLRDVEPSLPCGHDYWVMATQTCNLYNKDFAKISKVEWVAAKRVLDSVPAQKGGRNPRLLEVKASSAQGDVGWFVTAKSGIGATERTWPK
jgi:hypothetical protein